MLSFRKAPRKAFCFFIFFGVAFYDLIFNAFFLFWVEFLVLSYIFFLGGGLAQKKKIGSSRIDRHQTQDLTGAKYILHHAYLKLFHVKAT